MEWQRILHNNNNLPVSLRFFFFFFFHFVSFILCYFYYLSHFVSKSFDCVCVRVSILFASFFPAQDLHNLIDKSNKKSNTNSMCEREREIQRTAEKANQLRGKNFKCRQIGRINPIAILVFNTVLRFLFCVLCGIVDSQRKKNDLEIQIYLIRNDPNWFHEEGNVYSCHCYCNWQFAIEMLNKLLELQLRKILVDGQHSVAANKLSFFLCHRLNEELALLNEELNKHKNCKLFKCRYQVPTRCICILIIKYTFVFSEVCRICQCEKNEINF